MPSMTHQILVSLIRDNPTFGMHLLQQATGTALPKQASLRKTEAQFTDLKPPEYSADAAYLVENARGRALGAVIFEVQLTTQAEKAALLAALCSHLPCTAQNPCDPDGHCPHRVDGTLVQKALSL